MGLLDQMFGGGGGGKSGGGGMSPLMLALLGILAYKTFSGRVGGGAPEPAPAPGRGAPLPRDEDDRPVARRRDDDGESDGGLDDLMNRRDGGGLGDILAGGGRARDEAGRGRGRDEGAGGGLGDILGDILGGGRGGQDEGGRGGRGGGGLGDILGSVLGGGASSGGRGGQGGLGDILGSVLGGGGAGGGGRALSGGLDELLREFQQSGKGDVADSWVQTGPNRLVSGSEVGAALDPQVVDLLAAQTGMSREQVLEQIAGELPDVVDKLTPEGRLPTQDEAARWV